MRNLFKSALFFNIALLSFIGTFLGLLGCTDEIPDDIRTVEGNIPIGPYLQNLNSHSVSVLWTSLDDVDVKVRVEERAGNAVGEFLHEGIFHSTRITGLQANTQYTYEIEEDGHRTGLEGFFKTPPSQDTPGQNYSFAVIGDSGTASKAQYEVAHQMRLYNPDFILHVGDIIYPNGAENQYYHNFFRPYQDLLISKVFWPVLGNHGYQSEKGKPFNKFFETPANNDDKNERFYSFEYGSAFFVALDSETFLRNPIQQTFLETALANSQHTWKFVYLHHPLYSSGKKHGSDLSLRNQISPVLEAYQVDMVFSGHDHIYERTNSRLDYAEVGKGVIYIVTGGGGADLSATGSADFTERTASVHHFVGIHIIENQLTLQAIDNNGNVFDELRLEK